MRGGAQSHLIQASDNQFYVVKFRNNPQHRRILVNELIAAEILAHLQIPAPASELIRVPEEFLRENPEALIQLGSQSLTPECGWAFGSRYPGDPNITAIYDFVPDSLLTQVENRDQFLSVLAFDKWTGNADGRQAIFFRARLKEWAPQTKAGPKKLGFVALMIDHGFIFNGPHWNFTESALQGLYPRRMVYAPVRSLKDFEPCLGRILNFPDEVLDRALRHIPPDWIDQEEEELDRLLETLMRRKKRVGELLEQSAAAFVNWKKGG
jgi:hypothetical protein